MLALLASTALAVVGSARAADMQARPITKATLAAPVSGFEGWYLGFSFGYAATSGRHYDSEVLASIFETGTTGWKSGGFVGGDVGYNWRSGNIIFGIEGGVKAPSPKQRSLA
jgi:outer membrane immunogenic protein